MFRGHKDLLMNTFPISKFSPLLKAAILVVGFAGCAGELAGQVNAADVTGTSEEALKRCRADGGSCTPPDAGSPKACQPVVCNPPNLYVSYSCDGSPVFRCLAWGSEVDMYSHPNTGFCFVVRSMANTDGGSSGTDGGYDGAGGTGGSGSSDGGYDGAGGSTGGSGSSDGGYDGAGGGTGGSGYSDGGYDGSGGGMGGSGYSDGGY